jgi:hypothetical protein
MRSMFPMWHAWDPLDDDLPPTVVHRPRINPRLTACLVTHFPEPGLRTSTSRRVVPDQPVPDLLSRTSSVFQQVSLGTLDIILLEENTQANLTGTTLIHTHNTIKNLPKILCQKPSPPTKGTSTAAEVNVYCYWQQKLERLLQFFHVMGSNLLES